MWLRGLWQEERGLQKLEGVFRIGGRPAQVVCSRDLSSGVIGLSACTVTYFLAEPG